MNICTKVWDSNLIGTLKLSTSLSAYQHVYMYFSFTMTSYNTDLDVGFILHRHDGNLASAKTDLLLNSQVALPVGQITDCIQSWYDSVIHVPRGIVLVTLSIAAVCQCEHKLHKLVTPSGINVLNYIPCVWPPAVEQNYCIRHNKLWDNTADLLTEVCNSVSMEPCLQPVKDEQLTPRRENREDGARLDMAESFWGRDQQCAFFDEGVFNPFMQSLHSTSQFSATD